MKIFTESWVKGFQHLLAFVIVMVAVILFPITGILWLISLGHITIAEDLLGWINSHTY